MSALPLARLLAMAFRQLMDELHRRLAERGWTDVRGPYGFVLLAVRDEARTASELTELLGTTKQATSQLLEAMEAAGYVERAPHPTDARAKAIALAPRGRELLDAVEEVYREIEAEWAGIVGEARVEALREDLTRVQLALHGGRLPPVRPTW
jgi:DNA-binding MarR family transcriptional regulator